MVATVNKMGKDTTYERIDTSLLIHEDMERDSSRRSSIKTDRQNSEKEELFTEERNSRIGLLNIKPDNESYSKSNFTRSKTQEQLNLGAYVEKLI